jgi:ABC-type glycerol-3-phosphate transport system permease component
VSTDLSLGRAATPRPVAGATAPPRAKRRRPHPGRWFAGRLIGYVFLSLLSLAAVYPLLWMLVTSVKPTNEVFGAGFLPHTWTFDGYRRAWSQLDYAAHLWNSLWITTLTVVAVLALATLAGYSFAKLDFPAKQPLYFGLLSTLMVPATAVIIPTFLELKSLSLLDTRQGLLLVYIGTSLPFGMFLMRAFFETLPDELIQAARVDGAGEFTIFYRIMLPLAAPGVATVLIFQFMTIWNEFLYAQTFLQTPKYLPLQPVIYAVRGQHATDWPLLSASLTMTVVPIIVVYVRMQRRFVTGLTLGAVKD